jgi:F0F1-type ATP synthase delta subunit
MLPKLEGYAAALLGSLDQDALGVVANDLASLEQTVLARSDLRAVLSDTSIPGVARGQIFRDLLAGKLHPTAVRLSVYAATMVPAQEVDHAIAELAIVARTLLTTGTFTHTGLGLLAARRRVGGFADAILEDLDTSTFAEIETDLFAWARVIEGNIEVRRLLLDRDASLESRIGVTTQLLSAKVSATTLRLACYVVEGGRPRDVVGTLDYLTNHVAEARNWRVARVRTARALDETSRAQLVSSLTTLTGRNVELLVAEDPALLGGVLVQVGDLRLDATMRGRLENLHDAVASGRYFESALNRND